MTVEPIRTSLEKTRTFQTINKSEKSIKLNRVQNFQSFKTQTFIGQH